MGGEDDLLLWMVSEAEGKPRVYGQRGGPAWD